MLDLGREKETETHQRDYATSGSLIKNKRRKDRDPPLLENTAARLGGTKNFETQKKGGGESGHCKISEVT